MAGTTAEDVPPTLAQLPRGSRAKRAGLAAALLCAFAVILFAGYETAVRLVAPDAVRVRVAVAANGQTLATRTITDARTVADLYARITPLPFAGPHPVYSCPPIGPDTVTFTLTFTRWELPIEAATKPACGGWQVSRGGVYDVRDDPNGQTRAILDEIQPLGCPLAWRPQCDGY